jgi:hypothetical protein
MVLQPPQARVCSGSQSLLASSGVARSETEIAQLKALIGVATGPLAQRFAIGPERACTHAADNADDENGGVAYSRLRIVKDHA